MNEHLQIEKVLSANDVGETGSHMAGILVPRRPEFLDFFPKLNGEIKNPRVSLDILDDAGTEWVFQYIYYNGKFFGGTRNEYRLTGMTKYLRQFALKEGDSVVIARRGRRGYSIRFQRRSTPGTSGRIRLGHSSWRLVECDED